MKDLSTVLKDVEQYIQQTKSQHYGGSNVQAIDAIEASGHSTGFIMGSIVKYAMRYGKKGGHADQKKDLMKIIHYGLMALEEHNAKQLTETTTGRSQIGRVPLGEVTINTGIGERNSIDLGWVNAFNEPSSNLADSMISTE